MLLRNQAFDELGYGSAIEHVNNSDTPFQSWTQVVAHWKETYDFGGRLWGGFMINQSWKCARAMGSILDVTPDLTGWRNDALFMNEEAVKIFEVAKVVHVRLASFYRNVGAEPN